MDAIKKSPSGDNSLGIGTVTALADLSVEKWVTFFNKNDKLLPPFLVTGSLAERINAFIQHLQNFFTVSSTPSPSPKPTAGGLPAFTRANGDVLKAFISAYSGFNFGQSLDPTKFQSALNAVFSDDPSAREWLARAMQTINDLYAMTAKGIPQSGQPSQPDMQFSVMEGLYARGFTGLQSVQALTSDDFQNALTGTIAYDYASTIYSNAQGTGQAGQPLQQSFQPINSDGCLVNCIPPSYLSQLGPMAYLYEMLKVSETSTCEIPFPQSANDANTTTLKQMIAQRRGPLDTLHVIQSNLEIPLPLIDIVNECLEFLVVHIPNSIAGAVYDTNRHELGGYKLCTNDSEAEPTSAQAQSCHDPATLFEALPEHSSPATPVAQPAAYAQLKSDFSSCHLPYSQPLDISRSYLRQLETSRYALMRRFRKDITEFVLDPTEEPTAFERSLWRYPVRIDIAREYLDITPEEYDLLFTHDIVLTATSGRLLLRELYGFDAETVGRNHWTQIVIVVSEFLKRTCLTYCEFLELWKSAFVKFRCSSNQREGNNGAFPDCEPCCLDDYFIQFEGPQDAHEALKRLAV